MKFKTLYALLLVFALTVSGCGNAATSAPSAEPLAVEDTASFLAALQASDPTAEIVDSVTQDFFSPEGNFVTVHGQDVQVFEYESAQAMEAEASQVAADGGSVGTSMMMWVDSPHFYKAGRIIVLYIGNEKTTLDSLEKVMGPQFAGQ